MYDPKKMEITKRAIYHIIKSKLPLNHIQNKHYHFVLERDNIW